MEAESGFSRYLNKNIRVAYESEYIDRYTNEHKKIERVKEGTLINFDHDFLFLILLKNNKEEAIPRRKINRVEVIP